MQDERNQPPTRPTTEDDGTAASYDSGGPAGFGSGGPAGYDSGGPAGFGSGGPAGYDSGGPAGHDPDNPVTGDPAPSTQREYEPNRMRPVRAPQGRQPSFSQKAGWVALGIFLDVLGLLVVFLVYRRNQALLWSAFRYVIVGVGISLLIKLMFIQALSGAQAPSGVGPDAPGWTSTNF